MYVEILNFIFFDFLDKFLTILLTLLLLLTTLLVLATKIFRVKLLDNLIVFNIQVGNILILLKL